MYPTPLRIGIGISYPPLPACPQVQEAVREYEKVGSKHGLTCTELALAWCKSRWFVASSIIGATSMEQLKVGHVYEACDSTGHGVEKGREGGAGFEFVLATQVGGFRAEVAAEGAPM